MVDKAALNAQLPTGRDSASRLARHKIFSRFDPNGNGILSLAEVDNGLKQILQLAGIEDVTPAINRAFHAAREVAPPVADFSNDYVDKNEFRVLLVYLRHYIDLFELFMSMDTSGDRRMRLAEFQAHLPMLKTFGFKQVTAWENDPKKVFQQMDRNGGGVVLFDEFADFALRQVLSDSADDDEADRKDALETLRRGKPNLTTKNLPQMTRDLNFAQAPASARELNANAKKPIYGASPGSQSARADKVDPRAPSGVNKALGDAYTPRTGVFAAAKWDTTYKRNFRVPKENSQGKAEFSPSMMAQGKLAVRSQLDQQMAMYSTGELNQMLEFAGGMQRPAAQTTPRV